VKLIGSSFVEELDIMGEFSSYKIFSIDLVNL